VVDLTDAFEKLRWARHHLELLRPQIESFEKRNAHRISVRVDHDAGEYVFHVHDLEPPSPKWGLIVGDCIHNARTALDYVVGRLWALVTGVHPGTVEHIQFPIQSVRIEPDATEAEIEREWAAARDRFRAPAAKLGKEPRFSGYLATIEQLQPFNSLNPSIWGTKLGGPGFRVPRFPALPNALDRLSRLDNIDKHRVPHAAWATVGMLGAPSIDKLAPADFKPYGGSTTYAPLHNDAEVGRWRFQTPLPHHWEPDQMAMKQCFPLQVAFGEPSPFQGVIEVLTLCLWGVEAVLTIFSPVFEYGQPPLPVTAIAEPLGAMPGGARAVDPVPPTG
jgi:hypothetical protein